MYFKSALSVETDTEAAVDELSRDVAGVQADLAVVFASHHYGPEFEGLIERLRGRVETRNLIGCTGEGIIGPDREIEGTPALVLWMAAMPGVRVLPFYVDQEDLLGFETAEDWWDRIGVSPQQDCGLIVLPEPYSIDSEACLARLNEVCSRATIVGGLASGAEARGQNRLFLNDQVLRQGLVGVSLSGPVRITSVVSQGCRPVGEPLTVTRVERNVIHELLGRPAIDVLRGMYHTAAPAEQTLIQRGLFVGCAVGDAGSRQTRHDFLIRNLLGVVGDSGLAVNALVQPGQIVQFHVRDAQTADEEMQSLLTDKVAEFGETPGGGLLFSCNGRGRRMFGAPHHDIQVVNRLAAGCEVAGFFASGEIGPIGRRTYIHGFTSSLILFREA